MSTLLEQASLVMIPSGYKEDVVYSQIPLDGSGDMSFTRSSNGTRINSAGLVEVCPWNYFEYSNTFTNWANSGGSITLTTGQNDPSGGTNAALFARTLAYDYLLSYVPNDKYTVYCTVKKATSNFFRIAATSFGDAVFNINTGTVIVSDGGTASIISLGNGWYQCIMAFNSLNGGFYLQNFPVANADNGNGSVYIYQAQANIGSTAKPYFPTTDRLNVPRLTYQNGGGGCPSLLLEKQSTNEVSYSNGNAGMAFAGTLTLNNTTSPEGVSNAFSFLVNANANGGLSIETITTSAQSYTFSAYLKGSVNGQKVRLFGDLNNVIEDFTLTTDWVRYTKTFTGAVGAQSIYLLNGAYMSPAQNNLYYGYGMQLEVSSYATSLIPSNGASATRVADACFKTGISSLIGQTQGTIFVDLVITGTTGNNRFSISDGSNVNWIFIGTPEDGALRTSRFYIKTNGTVRVDVGSYSTGSPFYTVGQRYKIALAYKSGDWAVYGNGTLLYSGTDSIASVSSPLSVFDFFNTTGGIADCGEQVNETILFPTRLSNSELASLTSL